MADSDNYDSSDLERQLLQKERALDDLDPDILERLAPPGWYNRGEENGDLPPLAEEQIPPAPGFLKSGLGSQEPNNTSYSQMQQPKDQRASNGSISLGAASGAEPEITPQNSRPSPMKLWGSDGQSPTSKGQRPATPPAQVKEPRSRIVRAGISSYLVVGAPSRDFRAAFDYGVKDTSILKKIVLGSQMASKLSYGSLPNEVQRAWQQCYTYFGMRYGGIKSAYFLLTHWYNRKFFAGPVETENGQCFFVHMCKNSDDALLMERQEEFVRHHFGTSFTIPKVLDATTEGLVLTEWLSHEQGRVSLEDLSESIMDWAVDIFHAHQNSKQPVDNLVMLDMPILLEKLGASKLWPRITATLNRYRQVSVVPVHGDLTPWNAFRDQRGGIALVDVERCGWHVPFYDVFHMHVQTAAVFHNQAVFPDQVCTEIARTTGVSGDQIYLWFLMYLLDYMHADMTDKIVQGYDNALLDQKQAITLQLLEYALDLLDDVLQSAGHPDRGMSDKVLL